MLETVARLMVGEESAHFARFIVSEQMEPTAAFERLYEKVMAPLLETARRLVGALLAADPESEAVRLRTIATIGQILVLRVAHAAVMRQLQWNMAGAEEFTAIRAMIREIAASLNPAQKAGGGA